MTSEPTLIKSDNHLEFQNHIKEFINDGYKAKWETFNVTNVITSTDRIIEYYYIFMERKEKVDNMSEEMIMNLWNNR